MPARRVSEGRHVPSRQRLRACIDSQRPLRHRPAPGKTGRIRRRGPILYAVPSVFFVLLVLLSPGRMPLGSPDASFHAPCPERRHRDEFLDRRRHRPASPNHTAASNNGNPNAAKSPPTHLRHRYGPNRFLASPPAGDWHMACNLLWQGGSRDARATKDGCLRRNGELRLGLQRVLPRHLAGQNLTDG